MSTLQLVKAPLIVMGTISTWTTLTPPIPPPSFEERSTDINAGEKVFGRIVRYFVTALKLVTCAGGIGELAVILARQFPSSPLSQRILEKMVCGPASLTNKIGFSRTFWVGFALATVGGYIRWSCYRALGRLFTYEITIRKDHQLVTSGPYSWVRHPSYTSAVTAVVGMGICYGARGSWLRECGVLATPGGQFVSWAYVLLVLYGSTAVAMRTPQEDKLLKGQFGEQWDEWAKKVPYRLVPGIY
ncbi:hypothetical protein AcW1_009644 [Taiwanofungus camphoratus]|nr:hypothetical protein AcW1_009644 [Antrodia cinnamomea]